VKPAPAISIIRRIGHSLINDLGDTMVARV
jgi:hypothetical protein